MFDSIVNRGEYLSNHYLDALLQGDLTSLRRRWDETEQRDEPTGRSRLRALSRLFFATKAKAIEGDPARHHDEVQALHDLVLDALGFPPNRRPVTLMRADAEVSVLAAATWESHTGLLLVALDLGFATDVDAALEPDGAGRLLDPEGLHDSGARIREGAKAASALFGADEPPRYVLLLAGTILILADRGPWGEGRFLAVDLDLALSRNDTKAKGELETIAALFSADALVPEEGQSVADQLVSASRKHAVGVSKDLREGIRRSVELLADEVIEQRRAASLGVYNVLGLAGDLTLQSLRFLYRLLFLLYAEARPELGILPLDHPEYAQGYGLDRLRDLVLVDLTDERAQNGKHLHESLSMLFRLVNDGYHHDVVKQALALDAEPVSEDVGLRFEPLHSALFAPDATPLLDGVTLRNQCLQQVLRLLMLSKEKSGQDRGFVSYANLGINQLGAVYEGLMAYTGFFATEDLYEVARPGQAEHGTWVVPVTDADQYPSEVFVTRPSPETGQPEVVRHPKGSFVFRLSGRDRQRTASYYTPEVLTACVVRHALAELLDQDGETTPAGRILELTICEPALGSGAFLNEAINQLAHEYLRRRQAELDKTLDPDRYQVELQKVKAHIALHQCYGVDLNGTAVELAEVSLWLNAMYTGLQAPWFGLHLRRGNSLLGARRATYRRAQLDKAAWLKAVPDDRPLSGDPIGDDEIQHFLLPAAGWGSVADNKYARQLRPDAVKALKDWRKTITKPPSKKDADRLANLARRVEILWARALERLRLAERELRRPINVWEAPEPILGKAGSRAIIEEAIRDPNSPLGRLRLVMDAWCALWFWPVDGPDGPPALPTLGQWLDALEQLLGVHEKEPETGQLAFFDDLDDLLERDRDHTFDARMRPTVEVMGSFGWLEHTQTVARNEGFFHWELEFEPVGRSGGFDLQVGNPPWVRPEWRDSILMAEFDPGFAVFDREASASDLMNLTPLQQALYLDALASHEGLTASLTSGALHPILEGLHTNLYRVFLEHTARLREETSGIIALLHPDSHFVDGKALALRAWCYKALRRCWRFVNQCLLFEDIGNTRPYAVNVYGPLRDDIEFLMCCNLFHPETVDQSLTHDGADDIPGIKTPTGDWELRPHRRRVVRVEAGDLESWKHLFADLYNGAEIPRLPQLHSQEDLRVLEKMMRVDRKIGNVEHLVDGGLKETVSVAAGVIQRDCHVAALSTNQVFQNPHFSICNPYFQDANPGCKNHRDYSPLDLQSLQKSHVHRSNFRLVNRFDAVATFPMWRDSRVPERWRLMYKRRIDLQGSRTLQASILFPGPLYVDATHGVVFPSEELLVAACGLWASLPLDYFVRSLGKSDMYGDVVAKLPFPDFDSFYDAIALRVLRLNCLVEEYAPLWESLFARSWLEDSWTSDGSTTALSDVEKSWSSSTALRRERDRRLALVELDAIAALCLGLSCDELIAIYRSQFGVLRGYEHTTYFDGNGRRVPSDVLKEWRTGPDRIDLRGYVVPFDQPDREKEMRVAYEAFARRNLVGNQ